MCKAIIDKWHGRFGNNMMQLAHCCYFAFNQNSCHSISFPSKYFLLENTIQNTNDQQGEICKCDKIISPNKYTKDYFYHIGGSNWVQRRLMIQKYILPIVSKNITDNYENTLFDCCLHIRSGDACNIKHGDYGRLPATYYSTIINDVFKNNPDNIKIHILFEDSNIDVFKILVKQIESNPNITYTSKTPIEEALNIMMRSRILVPSVGTFSMVAMCMSKTIHTLYVAKRRLNGEHGEKGAFNTYSINHTNDNFVKIQIDD
jgi:hypothetical protein